MSLLETFIVIDSFLVLSGGTSISLGSTSLAGKKKLVVLIPDPLNLFFKHKVLLFDSHFIVKYTLYIEG